MIPMMLTNFSGDRSTSPHLLTCQKRGESADKASAAAGGDRRVAEVNVEESSAEFGRADFRPRFRVHRRIQPPVGATREDDLRASGKLVQVEVAAESFEGG